VGAGCLSDDYDQRKTAVLDELSEAVQKAIDLGTSVRLDDENLQDQTVVSLFLAIVEMGESVLILGKHDKIPDAKILVRSMLEAVLQLIAAKTIEDFPKRLLMEYAKKEKQRFEAAESGNAYFDGVYTPTQIKAQISGLENHIAKLESEGAKGPYKIDQLAEKLGDHEIYDGLYRPLSAVVHSSYASFFQRNINVDANTSDFEFVGFQLPTIAALEATIFQATVWVRRAYDEMNAYS